MVAGMLTVSAPVPLRVYLKGRVVGTTAVRLDAPNGTVHINAVPWAEVWIDGQRIGETPIGNLPARIGTREILFKHPDLGERRTTVLVTLKEPTRISMDLRKK